MTDALTIGGSALLAYRTALNTVSNNIANANTPGYARERTNLQANGSIRSGNLTIGTGVYVQNIQRLTDSFAQMRLVSDDSSYGRINLYSNYTAQVDGWLSSSDSGLASPLQGFFDSLNTLSSDPTSTSARESVLGSAQTLSSRFSSLQGQLQGLDTQVDGQTASTVSEINGYLSQIAKLNTSIVQSTSQNNGQQPNDLLDQRDQLMRSLASDVGISSVNNADGSVSISLANGQSLVSGGSAASLSVQADAYGRNRDIVLTGGGGTKSVVTQQISGGVLGGLQDFRRQVLDPAMNQLGQLSANVAQAVNAQQAAGVDQYGNLGSPIFSTPTVGVKVNSHNTGTTTATATIGDATQLGKNDYLLSYDGANWNMMDSVTGAVIPLVGNGTAASPLTGGGIQVVLSGAPATGDKLLIQPTHTAAAQLNVVMTDPAGIAAASPVQTSASSSNYGSATISSAQILDASNPSLQNATTIQFTSATTYTINGAGSFAYTPGSNIAVNGWQVQISGTPAIGDSFNITATGANSSDNSNANLLAGISDETLMNGGMDTISSANSALVSGVGAQDSLASAQLSAETAVRSQDQATSDAVSGVNLDEEAVSLTQLQQAYQASAQVVTAANTLFDALMAAVRG